jgi:uncharacterized protein YrrD
MNSRDLIGKLIVSIANGEIVGKVRDVLIDPNSLEIAALVLPAKLFRRQAMIIPRSVVHLFGKDVILVKSNETMARDDSLEHVASLIAVSAQMKGRPVATERGVRLGLMDDVIVDAQGKVTGYHLSKVYVSGSLARTQEVPLSAVRSMGPDLLLIDGSELNEPDSVQ